MVQVWYVVYLLRYTGELLITVMGYRELHS